MVAGLDGLAVATGLTTRALAEVGVDVASGSEVAITTSSFGYSPEELHAIPTQTISTETNDISNHVLAVFSNTFSEYIDDNEIRVFLTR